MGFMDDYEPVAVRQAKWWLEHPEGRIITTITNISSANVVIRAELYRDAADERPYAVGHAHESPSGSGVNSTSHIENCETSAIGRALATAGYAGTDPEKRPSREEMNKVNRAQPAAGAKPQGPAKEATQNNAWLDVLENPGGWYDNREDKKSTKAPDFKAKKGNDPFATMGEYNGSPAPLALWLNAAPDGMQEALYARDSGDDYSGMVVFAEDAARARGGNLEEALANLGAQEVENAEDDSEPF